MNNPERQKEFFCQRKCQVSLLFKMMKVRFLFGSKAGFAYVILKALFSQSSASPSSDAPTGVFHMPVGRGGKGSQYSHDLCCVLSIEE